MTGPEPTFLVIGAQKSGTTWLWSTLRAHPEVFLPRTKELRFWNREARWKHGIDAYRARFTGVRSRHRAIGECTSTYFAGAPDPTAPGDGPDRNDELPARLAAHLPDLRFVLLLRDPVERAVSAYFHHVGKRRIRPEQRIADVMERHGILSIGYYDVHLERWWRSFPRERFLVLIYEEDVAENRRRTVRRVYEHLGVDSAFVPSRLDARPNPRRSHMFMRLNLVSPVLAWSLERVAPARVRASPRWRIDIDPGDRQALSSRYAAHTERLSEMLGRSLPWG